MCELAESLSYKVRQEIRNRRLRLGYTQKDLASKIGTKYQVILQYEKGTRRISIKKLYAIAEALSTSARVLVSEQTVSKRCFENEGEEILNLVRRHKEIKDQESRDVLDVLVKSLSEGMQTGKEKVKKAEKIKIAKDLVKAGVAIEIISRATSLCAGEFA